MLVEKKILSDHFEEIYVSWFSRMKYFALEYVVSEEDAENIVQDVFTELWERKENLGLWCESGCLLFTSIKNRCIDLLRHRIVVKEAVNWYRKSIRLLCGWNLPPWNYSISLYSPSRISNGSLLSGRLFAWKMSGNFIKSKIEGKKQKDIAAELNISLKTVENQMAIAYKKIKSELKDYLPLLIFLLAN